MGCSKEYADHPETKRCPSRVVMWGLWFSRRKVDGGQEKNKRLEEAIQSGSTDTVVDHPSPIKRHVKWKMTHKPNLFHCLSARFPGRAGLTGKLYCPWTLGCTDCCHCTTRAPWWCLCCWSRCHDQTILWTRFKKLSQSRSMTLKDLE